MIPDAARKHVDFVDFPTINPNYNGKPYRYCLLCPRAVLCGCFSMQACKLLANRVF